MKARNGVPIAILLAGALAGATAARAASVDPEAVLRSIEDAGVSGVDVDVNDEGIVRLSGNVDDPHDGNMALKAARQVPGVTGVVDTMRWDD